MNTKIYSNTIEQGALDQFNAAMALPCAIQGALMPDAHQGYTFPIGSVIKTKGEVFPGGVGFDIGCGVACLELGINHKDVDLELLKKHILKTVPVGFNAHKRQQDFSTLNFDGTSQKLQDVFSLKGPKQLGTLGGGNHFIEVGHLESNGNIAIVIHSGSRGFGHGVALHYMQEAASLSSASEWRDEETELADDFKKRNSAWMTQIASMTDSVQHMKAQHNFTRAYDKYMAKQKDQYMKKQNIEGLHSFDTNSDIGKQYMIDQNFCLEYALLNRKLMIQNIYEGVAKYTAFSTTVGKGNFINRNHNHAELVDGHIIHRKGATHAEKDMLGVIPGNMRDGSFIVRGKGNPESLCSSSHGAGRVLSRKKAKATLSLAAFQAASAKLVTNHNDSMLDEAPEAYKDIFEVMSLQSDLVDVVDRVIPLLNIKG